MDSSLPASLEKTILASSSTYTRIQQSLQALSHVPAAYKHQKTYTQETMAKVDALKKAVEKAAEKTRTERAVYERLRDSKATKLAYALSRKRESYQRKAEKEEKTYVEALEAEMAARGRQEEAERALALGSEELDRLTQLSNEYTSLKSEIWNLYDHAFSNEDIPKDVDLRERISQADKAYHRTANIASSETRILSLLQDAETTVKECKTFIDKALELCAWDVTGRSPMTDDMQHNYLRKAKEAADAAAPQITHILQTSSKVRLSGIPKIPVRETRVEVFFLHPVYDLPSKEEMQTAAQGLSVVLTDLQNEIKATERRAEASSSDLKEAADVVNVARMELEVYRQSIFDAVLGRDGHDDAPPAYPHSSSERSPDCLCCEEMWRTAGMYNAREEQREG
ncbi:hypothetical protein CYLTODRAFT_423288 [Cylindrobasidium torrendii FP15055 ss-10]|uniref:Uncharacterized protein n=1 Tax=Cylindrobasidium torrendii FP15055 ss-10 TaxID=1314674 RepID=A0A0D7BAM3_9AGAR|nr:hypothetical protein CYLTODRAFT_423288 [Cylindrobasidium torrendii FP15055 ss-10]